MITITKLTKTCDACPAQWEGVTDKGEKVYIRYRWGCLDVGIGKDPVGADYGNQFSQQIGNNFDGELDYKKLRKIVAFIKFPLKEENESEANPN